MPLNVITNTIVSIISKPIVGLSAGGISGFALLLKILGVVGTIFGSLGAIAGGILTIAHFYFYIKKHYKTRKIADELICTNEECSRRKSLD